MEQHKTHLSLEIDQGIQGTAVQNRKLKSENTKLRRLVILFAIVALLAIAGLTAGVVIAVRQTNKAVRAEAEPPKVTTVYYFNDDDENKGEEAPLQPGLGIVDPVQVNNSTSSGSFVITAEDLLGNDEEQPIEQPIIDRIPVNEDNDPIIIDSDP